MHGDIAAPDIASSVPAREGGESRAEQRCNQRVIIITPKTGIIVVILIILGEGEGERKRKKKMGEKPERVKKMEPKKKNGPKKPRRVKKMDLRKTNHPKKAPKKYNVFMD